MLQLCKLIDMCTNELLAFGVSWNVPNSQAEIQMDIDNPVADSHLVYTASSSDAQAAHTTNAQTHVFTMNSTGQRNGIC